MDEAKTSNFEEGFDSLLIGPGPLLTDYKLTFTTCMIRCFRFFVSVD